MKPGEVSKFLEKVAERGEFHTLEDGFFYYWPSQTGAISAEQLRAIADHLDKLNSEWQEQLDEFSTHQSHNL